MIHENENLKEKGEKLAHLRAQAEYARMCADFNYPEGGQDAWDKIVEILG